MQDDIYPILLKNNFFISYSYYNKKVFSSCDTNEGQVSFIIFSNSFVYPSHCPERLHFHSVYLILHNLHMMSINASPIATLVNTKYDTSPSEMPSSKFSSMESSLNWNDRPMRPKVNKVSDSASSAVVYFRYCLLKRKKFS